MKELLKRVTVNGKITLVLSCADVAVKAMRAASLKYSAKYLRSKGMEQAAIMLENRAEEIHPSEKTQLDLPSYPEHLTIFPKRQ